MKSRACTLYWKIVYWRNFLPISTGSAAQYTYLAQYPRLPNLRAHLYALCTHSSMVNKSKDHFWDDINDFNKSILLTGGGFVAQARAPRTPRAPRTRGSPTWSCWRCSRHSCCWQSSHSSTATILNTSDTHQQLELNSCLSAAGGQQLSISSFSSTAVYQQL